MIKVIRNSWIVILLIGFNLLGQNSDYWQQEVHYKIDVVLDDIKHYLEGSLDMEYINHSPDTLEFIYFHLWPNAYKNRNTAFAKERADNGSLAFHHSSKADRGFIDDLSFTVDGSKVKLEYDNEHIDCYNC